MVRLNGWMRIWFLLATAIILFAAVYAWRSPDLVGWGEYNKKSGVHTLRMYHVANKDGGFSVKEYSTNSCVPLSGVETYDDAQAHGMQVSEYGPPDGTEFRCVSYDRFGKQLSLALLTSGIVVLLGLIIAWIRRGFATEEK